jgi:hypothetical protein
MTKYSWQGLGILTGIWSVVFVVGFLGADYPDFVLGVEILFGLFVFLNWCMFSIIKSYLQRKK